MYGGVDASVTNVYFTHGSLDQWHRMGVLSDLNEHSPSTVIPGEFEILIADLKSFISTEFFYTGVAHCKDLTSIDYVKDSKEVINSKVMITNLVKKWLKY